MASLSVAQAKDQLPAMLRRVEAGEIITITRNGKPVATVTPIDEAAEKQARRKALNDRIRAFAQTLPPQSDSVAMIRGMRGHDDGLPLGMIFFDSSALVAHFAAEPDASWVYHQILAAPAIAANELVRGECSSAILCKARTRAIEAETVLALLEQLDAWFADADDIPAITPTDLTTATTLCRHPDLALRMPDAIHLAQCQRLAATLLTRDTAMARAATTLGIAATTP